MMLASPRTGSRARRRAADVMRDGRTWLLRWLWYHRRGGIAPEVAVRWFRSDPEISVSEPRAVATGSTCNSIFDPVATALGSATRLCRIPKNGKEMADGSGD